MITVLKKNTFFDEWGTRKSEVEIQGDYTKEDIDKQLATDAPYGWWLNVRLVDTENNIYIEVCFMNTGINDDKYKQLRFPFDWQDEDEQLTGDVCPVCGYPIVLEYGLEVCYRCGWSREDEINI